MRKLLSCFALAAAFACGHAFAQEAAAPAAAPAPAAEAAPMEGAAAEAPVADAAPAAEAPAAEAPAANDAPAAAVAGGTNVAMAAALAASKGAPPPEGKGQIIFFRDKKFAGSAVRYKVREGETELGKLISGGYFVVPVEPGTHQYVVHSEAKDILTLEVEAGETYYVVGSVTMGFFAGHPNLSPSDKATFDGMLPKLKFAK
jgi:hypothetical protein